MRSSFTFKKKEKAEGQNGGSGGQSAFYFGCEDLDRVFGFQFPTASLTVIQEGYQTKHHLSLARYFVGAGITQSHTTVIYDAGVSQWEHMIPKPMEKKKLAKIAGLKASTPANNKIAWRYNTHGKAGGEKPKLKSDYQVLDLSKNEDYNNLPSSCRPPILKETLEIESVKELYESLENDLQCIVDSPDDISPKRVLLSGLETLFEQSSRQDLFKLFKALKQLVRTSRTVLLLALSPTCLEHISAVFQPQFESNFDFVMTITPIHSKFS